MKSKKVVYVYYRASYNCGELDYEYPIAFLTKKDAEAEAKKDGVDYVFEAGYDFCESEKVDLIKMEKGKPAKYVLWEDWKDYLK